MHNQIGVLTEQNRVLNNKLNLLLADEDRTNSSIVTEYTDENPTTNVNDVSFSSTSTTSTEPMSYFEDNHYVAQSLLSLNSFMTTPVVTAQLSTSANNIHEVYVLVPT